MQLDFQSDVPIYQQIAQSIEDDILNDVLEEEMRIPSTTEISLQYKVNPATVAKGFQKLVDEGIVYKKRGVGMFVSQGAQQRLKQKRKRTFYETYVRAMVLEAKKLDISLDDVIDMMKGDTTNDPD